MNSGIYFDSVLALELNVIGEELKGLVIRVQEKAVIQKLVTFERYVIFNVYIVSASKVAV